MNMRWLGKEGPGWDWEDEVDEVDEVDDGEMRLMMRDERKRCKIRGKGDNNEMSEV